MKRIRSTALTTIVAAAALAAPAAADSPPRAAGELLYTDGGQRVINVWPDGSHRRTVVPGVSDSWSADGRRYAVRTEDGFFDVDRATDSGPLVNALGLTSTAFLPGDYVLGTHEGLKRFGGGDIASGDIQRVATAADGTIVWTTRFEQKGLVPFEPEVSYTISLLRDGHVRQLPVAPQGEGAGMATISHDGDTIAYVDRYDGRYAVRVIAADAVDDTSTLAEAHPPADDARWPALSPDGGKVAFISSRSGIAGVYTTEAGVATMVPGTASPDSWAWEGLAWQPAQPAHAGTVKVAGKAVAGEKLTLVDELAESGTPGIETTVTWERCSDDKHCTDVGDGTNYALKKADLGSQIRVVRSVSNAAGNDVARSELSSPVVAPAPPTILWTGIIGSTPKQITVQFEGAAGSTFECRVDGGEWVECSSEYTTEPLSEGKHFVDVRQIAGGAPSQPAETSEVVDTTPPGLPKFTARPDAVTTATSAEIAWTGEDRARYVCKVDGEFKECKSPIKLSGLALGKHVVEVLQIDWRSNGGEWATVAWTVKAEEPAPAPEQPAEPVATPTPSPAPAPGPVVKPAPKFTATVADQPAQDGRSGNATVTVQDKGVDVGCKMTGVELAACKVDLYADVDTHGKASASARVLVGTGIVEADKETNKLEVRVVLNARGRELLRRNPQGLDVQVAITGTPVSGAPIEATGAARLVAKHSRVVVGGFDVDRAELTASAKRTLRKLAKKLAGGASVRVLGHTDDSAASKRYLRGLGLARAKAVKAFLAAHGAKATYKLVTRGATAPRATNATKSGRALNRRVVLEIVR